MAATRRPQGRNTKKPSSASRQTKARSSNANRPRQTARTANKKKVRERRVTSRALVLGLVVALLLGSYVSSLHAWWTQRAEIETKRAEIAALEQNIESIEREYERWRDDAFIEQQARERFGWVMPGEVGYKVIGLDGEVKGATTSLSEPGDGQATAWYTRMWGSITWAGKPEEERKSKLEGPPPDTVLD